MKAVEVVWYDAFDISTWLSRDEVGINFPPESRGKLCRTRGWLVHQDEYKLVVSQTWCPEVESRDEAIVSGNLVVPMGMVVEVIEQDG
jgi:hypothetical protein